MLTYSNYYRKIFFEAHGDGPFTCFRCEEDVPVGQVLVHHVDLDHKNNVLENLVAAHSACHLSYHNEMTGPRPGAGWPKGRPHPGVAASNRRRRGEKRPPLSDEHKAAVSRARRAAEEAKRAHR